MVHLPARRRRRLPRQPRRRAARGTRALRARHLRLRTQAYAASPQLTVASSGCFDQINQAVGFVPVVSGGEAKYSKEQVRWVEESIRIRRAAEPADLIEAVQPVLQQSFYAWDSVCSGVLL